MSRSGEDYPNTDTRVYNRQGPRAYNMQDNPEDTPEHTDKVHKRQAAHHSHMSPGDNTEDVHHHTSPRTDMPPDHNTDTVHQQASRHSDMPPGDDTDDVHIEHAAHVVDMPPGDNTEKVHSDKGARHHTDMPPGDDTGDVHTEQVARSDTAVHTGDPTHKQLRTAGVCAGQLLHTHTHTDHTSGQDRGSSDNNAVGSGRRAGTVERGRVERRTGLHRFRDPGTGDRRGRRHRVGLRVRRGVTSAPPTVSEPPVTRASRDRCGSCLR